MGSTKSVFGRTDGQYYQVPTGVRRGTVTGVCILNAMQKCYDEYTMAYPSENQLTMDHTVENSLGWLRVAKT